MKTLTKTLLALLLTISTVQMASAMTLTAVKSGGYHHIDTWKGGSLPDCGDIVVIPAGVTVSLDNDINLGQKADVACFMQTHIYIYGTLMLKGAKINLECGSGIEVMKGGCLDYTGATKTNSSEVLLCGERKWIDKDGTMNGPIKIGTPMDIPVEFVNFDADLKEGAVNLSWQVAFEMKNKSFKMEKSIDGTDWVEVGVVPSIGFHSDFFSYQFNYVPDNPSVKEYYRLSHQDIEGKSKILAFDYINRAKENKMDQGMNPPQFNNKSDVTSK